MFRQARFLTLCLLIGLSTGRLGWADEILDEFEGDALSPEWEVPFVPSRTPDLVEVVSWEHEVRDGWLRVTDIVPERRHDISESTGVGGLYVQLSRPFSAPRKFSVTMGLGWDDLGQMSCEGGLGFYLYSRGERIAGLVYHDGQLIRRGSKAWLSPDVEGWSWSAKHAMPSRGTASIRMERDVQGTVTVIWDGDALDSWTETSTSALPLGRPFGARNVL